MEIYFTTVKNGFVALTTSDDLQVQKVHGIFLPKLAVHRNKKNIHTLLL